MISINYRTFELRLLVIFFLSGAVALIYQILWQRMLAGLTGADTFSVAIVVASFMLGLGVGNYSGGILADRLSPKQCIRLFGFAECTIGLFAFLSPSLFLNISSAETEHYTLISKIGKPSYN